MIVDELPLDITKLVTLRKNMLKDGVDIFSQIKSRIPLIDVTTENLKDSELQKLIPADVRLFKEDELTKSIPEPLMTGDASSELISGIMSGIFKNTKQQGSYNIVVTASGSTPTSKTRFVRKQLFSVHVS